MMVICTDYREDINRVKNIFDEMFNSHEST